MNEAATTNVKPNHNGNGTSNSIAQTKAKTNGHHMQMNSDSTKSMGRAPRSQNYNNNNRQNNNNNNHTGGSGGSPDLKNPRRAKHRYNRNNIKMSGPSDSNGPIRQTLGGEDHRPSSSPSTPINQSSSVRGQTPIPSSVKSWSNVVSSSYVQNGYQELQSSPVKQEQLETVQVASNDNKRLNRSKKTGNRFEERSNNKTKPEETDFNADAKIEAIQFQLNKTLNDMQTKADLLKNLQEEIKSIKLERDGKIDELSTERTNLIEQLHKLKTELSETDNQISNINATMGQLKMNKIQKIRSLEEHSRALLNDRAAI